jgi:glycosyltransferase involved in cell wall biosynthesis
MSSPSATVVITTKNRKADLVTAVESALAQTARPQVLVLDDGSTDGTADLVREKFPTVKLDRVEVSRGLIVQRNRAAKLADGEILFSIDDDAAFSTPNTVAQTLAEFDRPRIGAVAIPYIDVKRSPQVKQLAPGATGIFLDFTYIGTAHALRRDMFLQLGGYREFLFHQGEEMDFTTRMLERGWVVRLGRADPIHHFESPRRDFRRMDLYGRRNDVLYAWHNVPMPYFPMHLLVTTLKGIRFGLSVGRPLRMIQGLAMGYGAILHELAHRRPPSRRTYQIARLLRKRRATPIEEVAGILPALVSCP